MNNHINLAEADLDLHIYRIVSVDRLLSMFDSGQNALLSPDSWDDPFENSILRSKVRLVSGEVIQYQLHRYIYGQCWTLNKASDAMWRIYSQDKRGVRIRTTIRKLLGCLWQNQDSLPEVSCYIGKVSYLGRRKMLEFANTVFDDSGIINENIFRSLLVKRLAFKHEREVRLLFLDIKKEITDGIYSYPVDMHELIDQLMVDPRLSRKDAAETKLMLRRELKFQGKIKRSLLYAAPEEVILNVTDA